MSGQFKVRLTFMIADRRDLLNINATPQMLSTLSLRPVEAIQEEEVGP